MGSSTSSSSTRDDPDCYIQNKMMRQQCLRTRPNNESILPKPYLDKNYSEGGNQPPMTQNPGKTQIGCDCQGNVVECDENGRIIRIIKSNNR
jgi:hypothetical protein